MYVLFTTLLFQSAFTARDIVFTAGLSGDDQRTIPLDGNTSLKENISVIRQEFEISPHKPVSFIADFALVDIGQNVGSEHFPCSINIVKTQVLRESFPHTKESIVQNFCIQDDFLQGYQEQEPESSLKWMWGQSQRACTGWMLILGGIHNCEFDEDVMNFLRPLFLRGNFYDSFNRRQNEEWIRFITKVTIQDLKATLQRYPDFTFMVENCMEFNPVTTILETWINDPLVTEDVWKDLGCDKYGSRIIRNFIRSGYRDCLPRSLIDALCKPETIINFYGNHVVAELYRADRENGVGSCHFRNRIKQQINRQILSQKFRYGVSIAPIKLMNEIVFDDPDFVWSFFENNPSLIRRCWTGLFDDLSRVQWHTASMRMRWFLATNTGALYHALLRSEVDLDIEALLN